MSSVLKDAQILLNEGLYEEAERRLIEFLADNPRDKKAVQLLYEVERHLHLERSLEVRIPNKQKALEELMRIARVFDLDRSKETAELHAWLQTAPPELVVDLAVMLGTAGWHELWAEMLDKIPVGTVSDWKMAEACGWISRFYLEAGQPLRARQWIEKGLSALSVPKGDQDLQEIWKQLSLLHVQCLWDAAELKQATAKLSELSEVFPEDQEIKWLLEHYKRDQ